MSDNPLDRFLCLRPYNVALYGNLHLGAALRHMEEYIPPSTQLKRLHELALEKIKAMQQLIVSAQDDDALELLYAALAHDMHNALDEVFRLCAHTPMSAQLSRTYTELLNFMPHLMRAWRSLAADEPRHARPGTTVGLTV